MIEPLESRIAPASVFTVTDLNGDQIRFTSSKGTLSGSNVTAYATAPDGVHNVYSVILDAQEFEGTNFTATVIKHGGGDGHALIGVFSAAGRHLGAVSLGTDVGQIVTGGPSGTPFSDTAIKTLTVGSVGRFGIYGNGDVNSKHSIIGGGVGSLAVKGDYNGALLEVDGRLAALTIGGSIIGGVSGGEGQISANEYGKIVVKGDLHGGAGEFTGSIVSGGSIGSISVGGSVIGGFGENSGDIYFAYNAAGTVGTISIAGSLLGGGGGYSGSITAGFFNVPVVSVTIGHDIVGSTGSKSGSIISSLITLDRLTIRGSLIGGSAQSGVVDLGLVKTATILGDVLGGSGGAAGRLGASSIDFVTIGGSIVGGTGQFDGQVTAGGRLGKVTVHGAVIGGAGVESGTIETLNSLGAISVAGSVLGGSGDKSGSIRTGVGAIDSITIGGDVRGGAGVFSGGFLAGTNIPVIKIGGSLYGGKGDNSGDLFAATFTAGVLNSVSIVGSIIGGAGVGSGSITNHFADDHINAVLTGGSIFVGGYIAGGSGNASGAVDFTATTSSALAKLTVKGSLYGGLGTHSGEVNVDGHVGTVLIGGSIYGGSGDTSGYVDIYGCDSFTVNHSIYAGSASETGLVLIEGTLANLKVGGDLRGSAFDKSGAVLASTITKKTILGLQTYGTGVLSGRVVG